MYCLLDSGYENGGGGGGGAADDSSVVAVDQLLAEVQSVAVEWKSLRQAKSCSCAMPFEHHSKKVRRTRTFLSVCPCTYLKNHTATLHQICNACCLRLNVPVATLQYVTYLWFCGLHHAFHIHVTVLAACHIYACDSASITHG